MRKRMSRFVYAAIAALAVMVVSIVTGCGGTNESTAVSGETAEAVVQMSEMEAAETGQPEMETKLIAEKRVLGERKTESREKAPDTPDSLAALRQEMEEPELFAVAHLGRTESAWNGDGRALLEKLCPDQLKKWPFLGEIPKERIIGAYGDLYCIVPKEETSSLAVNQMTWVLENDEWKAETDQVLYRSESGTPVLLFCNEEGYLDSTDAEVWVTDADGRVIRWEPVFLDGIFVPLPTDGKGHYAARDFTSYGPEEPEDYQAWLSEPGWYVPVKEELSDTEWMAQVFPSDGKAASYTLSLFGNADGYSDYDGEANLYWCYGGDWEMQEEYSGWWSFAERDGKAFLRLDLGRTGGIQYREGEEWKFSCKEYPVLRHEETGHLLLLKGNGEDILPFWKENQPFVILGAPYN